MIRLSDDLTRDDVETGETDSLGNNSRRPFAHPPCRRLVGLVARRTCLWSRERRSRICVRPPLVREAIDAGRVRQTGSRSC